MARATASQPGTRVLGQAQLRPPKSADAAACGRIIYEAFRSIADRHLFPHDFPALEAGIGLAQAFIGHPQIYGVVAEHQGRIVGSNFLDERAEIRGVGPITVDPASQQQGLGRRLMQAVLDRGRNAEGIRLVQDAFNLASYSLYTSLGFDVKEPLVLMQGRPAGAPRKGYIVRPMQEHDLEACSALSQELYGVDRALELRDLIRSAKPFVAEKGGQVRAYVSAVGFWAFHHAVADTPGDLEALFLGAAAQVQEPFAFLLPTRQSEFFRWCLREGFRGVKPMTLMAMGAYQAPRGLCLPSVLF